MTGRRRRSRRLPRTASYRGQDRHGSAAHKRLATLLCAFVLLLAAGAPASAQSYAEALAKFTTDSYSDTDAGIAGVATSGNPLAAQVIEALQDGRLLFSADDKRVYIRERSGAVLDAATGKAASGAPANLKPVRINNRLRRSIEAALGGLTLLSPDAGKRFEAAQAVFKSKDPALLPTLDTAIGKETDQRVKRALQEARAAVILLMADAKEADKVAAIGVIRDRGDQDSRGLLARPARQPELKACSGCSRGHHRHGQPAGGLECGAEPLVRAVARLGAAAGGDRPCHHLRRDGRHQHGARRDGHARRLHHVRGAGGDPHQRARACSTIRWRLPFRWRSWWPRWSASPSSAASFSSCTAGRSRPCSPPGASA